jgi:hypothetical protein
MWFWFSRIKYFFFKVFRRIILILKCLSGTSLMTSNIINRNPLAFSRAWSITISIILISLYNSHLSSVTDRLLNNLCLIWLLLVASELWNHSIFFNPISIITRSCNLLCLELILIIGWLWYILNDFLHFLFFRIFWIQLSLSLLYDIIVFFVLIFFIIILFLWVIHSILFLSYNCCSFNFGHWFTSF